jgi:hypothetical protein
MSDEIEDDSQYAYESLREREWTADMLRTPWAIMVNGKDLFIIDTAGEKVAEILSPTQKQALLAASKIIDLVNEQY